MLISPGVTKNSKHIKQKPQEKAGHEPFRYKKPNKKYVGILLRKGNITEKNEFLYIMNREAA